jgi:hypothetical protein
MKLFDEEIMFSENIYSKCDLYIETKHILIRHMNRWPCKY